MEKESGTGLVAVSSSTEEEDDGEVVLNERLRLRPIVTARTSKGRTCQAGDATIVETIEVLSFERRWEVDG